MEIGAAKLLETMQARCPLVAILRGIAPDEVDEVGALLADLGFTMIEVPLNSPEPFDSIERLAKRLGDRLLIGAGTVTAIEHIGRLRAAGGRLMVSPHCDPRLVEAGVAADMVVLPGVFTPSEAFGALRAGAHGLKIFPAELASPRGVRALRSVLPPAAPVYAVGGIAPEHMSEWSAAGATGFGIGSNLYRPGKALRAIEEDGRAFVAAAAAL